MARWISGGRESGVCGGVNVAASNAASCPKASEPVPNRCATAGHPRHGQCDGGAPDGEMARRSPPASNDGTPERARGTPWRNGGRQIARQAAMGGHRSWRPATRRRCPCRAVHDAGRSTPPTPLNSPSQWASSAWTTYPPRCHAGMHDHARGFIERDEMLVLENAESGRSDRLQLGRFGLGQSELDHLATGTSSLWRAGLAAAQHESGNRTPAATPPGCVRKRPRRAALSARVRRSSGGTV